MYFFSSHFHYSFFFFWDTTRKKYVCQFLVMAKYWVWMDYNYHKVKFIRNEHHIINVILTTSVISIFQWFLDFFKKTSESVPTLNSWLFFTRNFLRNFSHTSIINCLKFVFLRFFLFFVCCFVWFFHLISRMIPHWWKPDFLMGFNFLEHLYVHINKYLHHPFICL